MISDARIAGNQTTPRIKSLPDRQQQLAGLLYNLLPTDGSAMGNASLLARLKAAAEPQGLAVDEVTYRAARDALVAAGRAVKGRGRGGATVRS